MPSQFVARPVSAWGELRLELTRLSLPHHNHTDLAMGQVTELELSGCQPSLLHNWLKTGVMDTQYRDWFLLQLAAMPRPPSEPLNARMDEIMAMLQSLAKPAGQVHVQRKEPHNFRSAERKTQRDVSMASRQCWHTRTVADSARKSPPTGRPSTALLRPNKYILFLTRCGRRT